jgi:hypothetical protein
MDAMEADTFFKRKHVTGEQTHQSVHTFNLWHYQRLFLLCSLSTHMIAPYEASFSDMFAGLFLAAWTNSMEQSPS